ncbi:hypothetical protein EVG20_g8607 [Dentipellis fragilis]|uniref:PIG-U-domain-containing protein n=1 Tax=Dentipellis fragilis TaxID=205917 RepID=A0A4Y9Y570_9AGAM|nr:hypothetical protein EVG20_g8607 [Dentipellis fragilis]
MALSAQLAFPALVAARLLLALSPLPDILKDDNQLSSPLTSYSRLREGIYLFRNGIDPYAGGTFRHMPWRRGRSCGYGRARSKTSGAGREGIVAASYLLNPYLFLSSLALSTSTFENALVLLALMFACEGRPSPALLTLALSAQLSLPTALLLPAITMLLLTTPLSQLATPRAFPTAQVFSKRTGRMLAEFGTYFAVLTAAATIAAGGMSWAENTWGAGLALPDLTPNPGLWWYFFTEMFDYFRPFFLVVFSVHLVIYVVPLCVKFQHDPLYAAFLLFGVFAVFKPYATLPDSGIFISMLSLFPEVYPYLRYPLVTALLHVHASALLPLFHHLWTRAGTGNANFFYASTLVLGLAGGGALIDCAWAGLRVAIGGAGKEGAEWVVVQE